jgi:ankyrin repeat protein
MFTSNLARMTIRIFSFFFFHLIATGCMSQQGDIDPNSLELFIQISDLAKAVAKQDSASMVEIVRRNPKAVQYQEKTFGTSLLHWAVRTGREISVRQLLLMGANPNLHDTYDGETPIIIAAGYGVDFDTSTAILRLLLKFGGDPNSVETGPRRDGNTSRNTALIKAAGCCMSKTKLLVEAGADINFVNEFHSSALESAMRGGKEHLI